MKLLKRFLRTVFPTSQLHNSRTVRYAFSFSFLFLFATVLGMAAVVTKSGSSVKIIADQSAVELGQVFSVDVYVYASQPINAVDLSVVFPADQVEILGIDRGESVITLWTDDPHVEGSSIIMRGGTYKKGFVGEHKIATINARAKTTGLVTFVIGTVKLLAGDGLGSSVDADTSTVAITTVVPVGQLPLAATKGNGNAIVVTDIDGDGAVSLKDISSFMASWSGSGGKYDFNNDGVMTFKDFSIILSDYFLHK
jgi:hypothetical protein